METREIRLSPLDFEVRGEDDKDDEMVIKGHASVFNSLSEDLGGFREMVKPGSFKRTLDEGDDDVRALAHHDTAQVLGRTANDTLQLREDEIGLAVRIELPNNTLGKDIRESVRRGDLDKMSIGFNVAEEEWDFPTEGVAIRTITDIDLFEVSIVAWPAFRQTDISLAKRSMEQARGTVEIPSEDKFTITATTCERLLRQKQLELDL